MLNRRSLMFTGAALVLGGCAARATPTPPSGGSGSSPAPFNPPSVGPAIGAGGDGTWTGLPLSGLNGQVTQDTLISRPAAGKAAAHWLRAGECRLYQDEYVGVMAFSLASDNSTVADVQSVTFFGDCATTTVSSPSYRTYSNSRGETVTEWGYWIKLNSSAFKTVSTAPTSKVRIFARIKSNDPAKADRIIGNYIDPMGVTNRVTDWEMSFYPRANRSDFDVTVGPSTGTYATIAAAYNAARSANAECPYLTLVDSGAYELTDGNSGTAGTANAKGLSTIAPAPGVTATLGRAAAFNPNDSMASHTSSWFWRPGWPGIWFKGKGIVWDQKNVVALRNEGRCILDGIKMTNSNAGTGTDWRYYWNKGVPPGFTINNDVGVSVSAWHFYGIYEYGSASITCFCYAVIGVKMQYMANDPFQSTQMVVDTYMRNMNTEPWHMYDGLANPAYTLHYTGAGVGTHSVSGNMGDAGRVFTLTDGAGTLSLTIGQTPGAGNFDLAADIMPIVNARSGWSMTTVNNQLGAQFINGPFSNTDCKTSTQTFYTHQEIHSEWYQGYNGGNFVENGILVNNQQVNCYWGTGIIFMGSSPHRDFFILNLAGGCLIDNGHGSTTGGYGQGGTSGVQAGSSHCVVANCYFQGGFQVDTSVSSNSLIAQNLWEFSAGAPATWPTVPVYKNNYMVNVSGNLVNGAGNTGNFTDASTYPNDSQFKNAWADRQNGLLAVNQSGFLSSHLSSPVVPFDLYWASRAGSDCWGPVAAATTPPALYDFTSPA